MKKFALLALALNFGLVGPVFANVKIGIVNIQKVLVTIQEGKTIRKKLEKKFTDRKSELKKEEDAIKKAQASFQKQTLVLSDKAKAKKEREIQKMIMGIQKKMGGYQKELANLEKKFKEPILKRLEGIVRQVSQKAKVEMTFEISTSPVVYAANKVDLTDDVIKIYDGKYPAK